jgi:phage shock protein C
MNKTVNINLGGLPFILDEPAYNKLHTYLQALQRSFAATEGEGHIEIMADIEARVAEILTMKLANSKQIVTIADIDEVISIMGKPEDLGADTTAQGATDSDGNAYKGDFRRRIYRDEDNATVGGVCSGLGAYFDIDPVWIRIAFAIAILVFGSGVMLYIILWAVIPAAKTPAQKLEMRGDNYDLNNIKRSFKEEGERFGKRMEEWGKEFGSEENKRRFKRAGRDIVDSVTPAARRAADIVSKVFLSIALFFVAMLFVVLAVVLFSDTSSFHFGEDMPFETSMWRMASLFTESDGETNLLMLGLALFALTPLFTLLFNIVRKLFGVRKRVKLVGIAASVLWWVGVVICGLETYRIVQRFDEKGSTTERVDITQPKGDTLTIETRIPAAGMDMPEIEFFGDGEYLGSDDPITLWPQARINIQPSETDKFYIKLIRMSRGKNSGQAELLAKDINIVHEVKDSSRLVIEKYGTLPPNSLFRGQRVTVVVYVPKGKYVSLDNSVDDISVTQRHHNNPEDLTDRVLKMDSTGKLTCLTCPKDEDEEQKKDKSKDEDF